MIRLPILPDGQPADRLIDLAKHLHECGPRAVHGLLEQLTCDDLADGRALMDLLERFGQLDPLWLRRIGGYDWVEPCEDITPEPEESAPHSGEGHACTCEIDFDRISKEALRQALPLLTELLPEGRFIPSDGVFDDDQYMVGAPFPGSFLINLGNGKWGELDGDVVVALGDDLIELVSHLRGLNEREAAKFLAAELDIDWRPVQGPDITPEPEDDEP